jgi:lysophospholipase L1-like esterase
MRELAFRITVCWQTTGRFNVKVSATALVALLALACAAPSTTIASASSDSSSTTVGVMDNPCAALLPPPEVPAGPARAHRSSTAALAAASKAWEEQQAKYDFGGLCRYRLANAKLPQATSHRVVFMGDSITQGWIDADPSLFTDDVIDRGVSGQTTPQMLLRFRQDVIDLHPAVVHILAGTNDIAGNTGPTSLQAIEGNIQSMVELARAHHIRVILASVTPVAQYPWQPSIRPVETIRALNGWMKSYAQQNGLTYVDYFSALDDGHRGFIAKLAIDGVHPNAQGYAVMDKLAKDAIKQALASSP